MTVRKLDRTSCAAPICLGSYHHGTHTWNNVASAHKAEIRTQLETLQGKRCAYCEGDLESLGQHIEHFRRKSAHPALTFDWDNLFWSCDRKDSCGHFKDRGAGPYNVADLINSCSDEPDDFLVFRADGTISVRQGLPANNQQRAEETLRVFALDANGGRLRSMRKAAVSGYVDQANEAFDLGFSPDEIRALFASELQIARNLPFCTAIRHVLTERQ
jgi:uncharacterized protein (TIGR02646 family)